jgi:hypothetical protein
MLAIKNCLKKLAIKKCLKKRGHFIQLSVNLLDKSDTFAKRKKRLFSLVADSPQTGLFIFKYYFDALK